MASRLDEHLAVFLRKKRGNSTYVQFARKLGIAPSTLHRLENREQSGTLQLLHQILRRLRCRVRDVFPEDA